VVMPMGGPSDCVRRRACWVMTTSKSNAIEIAFHG
jgi:hypothetical protein